MILQRVHGEATEGPRTVVLDTELVVGDASTYVLAGSRT
jgi:hypothetical protein